MKVQWVSEDTAKLTVLCPAGVIHCAAERKPDVAEKVRRGDEGVLFLSVSHSNVDISGSRGDEKGFPLP